MDALLIGSGLAAGGYLLNTNQSKKVSDKDDYSKDIYDNKLIDTRLFERNSVERHLQKGNTINDGMYIERPASERQNTMSLTGEVRQNNEFTHSNMVPFFGSRVRQNTDANRTSGILERYTGVSNNASSKEEVAPMFELQRENIYGSQDSTDALKDRYTASRFNQGVPLTEPVQVGPGLGQGFTAEPTGGFQQENTRKYAQTRGVDELRAKTNPKVTYEGRMIDGFKGSRRGMTPVISKNRVIRFHSYNNEPRMNTTVVRSGERAKENFVNKDTNRQNTHQSYTGNAGPSVVKQLESHGKYLNQTTHRQNLQGYGFRNAQDQNREPKINIQYCSEVRKSEPTPSILGQASSVVSKIIAPLQDILRPTLKETNIHDSLPQRNFASIQKAQTTYDPNDIAKTTQKELLIHNEREGFMDTTSQQIHAFNSNDVSKPTIKETLIHSGRDGHMRNTHLLGPTAQADKPKKTARETLKQYIDSTNPTGNVKNSVYNNNIAKTTTKETIHENNYKGTAAYMKGQGYTTNPVCAPPTNKEDTSNTEYVSQAHGSQYGAYKVTNVEAPNTNKQETSNVSYTGIAQADEVKPTSYEDIYNATLNEIKESISLGREPTQTSIKVGAHTPMIGHVEEREGLEERDVCNVNLTPIQNTVIDSQHFRMNTDKCQYDTQDRLDPSNLTPFQDNPFTHSLHSSV